MLHRWEEEWSQRKHMCFAMATLAAVHSPVCSCSGVFLNMCRWGLCVTEAAAVVGTGCSECPQIGRSLQMSPQADGQPMTTAVIVNGLSP